MFSLVGFRFLLKRHKRLKGSQSFEFWVSAVSPRLRVQLQPVDVLPPVDLQTTVMHGLVRTVGAGRAGHQRRPGPGEEIGHDAQDTNSSLLLSHCITACVCAQVADECLAPDVLSTVKEMKAINFRRVPKMPVYGMAQPTSEVDNLLECLKSLQLMSMW